MARDDWYSRRVSSFSSSLKEFAIVITFSLYSMLNFANLLQNYWSGKTFFYSALINCDNIYLWLTHFINIHAKNTKKWCLHMERIKWTSNNNKHSDANSIPPKCSFCCCRRLFLVNRLFVWCLFPSSFVEWKWFKVCVSSLTCALIPIDSIQCWLLFTLYTQFHFLKM